jgi:hypothetical protein
MAKLKKEAASEETIGGTISPPFSPSTSPPPPLPENTKSSFVQPMHNSPQQHAQTIAYITSHFIHSLI